MKALARSMLPLGLDRNERSTRFPPLDLRARNFFASWLFKSGMKTPMLLIVLASLSLAIAGCSRHSQTASLPKNNDLGVIDVSSSKPSSYTLADGRACVITPTVLQDGNVSLTTRIEGTNGSRTLTFEAPVDGRAYTFGFDKSTVITVALRK